MADEIPQDEQPETNVEEEKDDVELHKKPLGGGGDMTTPVEGPQPS